MKDKEILIHLLTHNSCDKISCHGRIHSYYINIHACPGYSYYTGGCTFDDNGTNIDKIGIIKSKSKMIEKFIKLYGKGELMEALL